MFYKITLNTNHTNYKKFIDILEDTSQSSNSEFIDNSFLVYNNELKSIYIFYLQYPELYYKNNYEHFTKFKNMSEGCIVEYHEYNIGLEIESTDWVVNEGNNFLRNYFMSLLHMD